MNFIQYFEKACCELTIPTACDYAKTIYNCWRKGHALIDCFRIVREQEEIMSNLDD